MGEVLYWQRLDLSQYLTEKNNVDKLAILCIYIGIKNRLEM